MTTSLIAPVLEGNVGVLLEHEKRNNRASKEKNTFIILCFLEFL
jgi:hypothetical protein